MRRYAWFGVGLALAATTVALAAVPETGDVAVNATTAGVQERSAVAMDADGDSVVVWQGPDAGATGVFARRVNTTGVPQGAADIPVNTTTAGAQGSPGVAMEANGDFVVVWEGPDANGRGVFARRFNAAGTPLGGEVQVNTTTDGDQIAPEVAMDSDGDFVVAWSGNGEPAAPPNEGRDPSGIFARRFDASGAPQGAELPVNGTIAGTQVQSAVGIDPGGDFVVTWDSLTGDPLSPTSSNVFARRFDAGGAAQGAEVQVNATGDPAMRDSSSSVAMDADGDFAVAWFRRREPPSQFSLFVQLFTAAGVPHCGEIRADPFLFSVTAPKIVMDAAGNFVVVWTNDGEVRYRPFDAAGIPLFGGEFVNVNTNGVQRDPAVGSAPDGGFVVSWDGEGNPSGEDTKDHDGIYARLFGPEPPLNLPVLRPPFDASYSVHHLGAPPGVPMPLGGLIVKAGQPAGFWSAATVANRRARSTRSSSGATGPATSPASKVVPSPSQRRPSTTPASPPARPAPPAPSAPSSSPGRTLKSWRSSPPAATRPTRSSTSGLRPTTSRATCSRSSSSRAGCRVRAA